MIQGEVLILWKRDKKKIGHVTWQTKQPLYQPISLVSDSSSIVTLPGEVSQSFQRNIFVVIQKHLRNEWKSKVSGKCVLQS